MKKILSIDGGGTRGIIPATFLNCIAEDTGKHPLDLFDIFTGTSTGGIITLALSQGVATSEIVNLFLKESKRIFADSTLDDVRDAGNLFGAQYDNANLKKIVTKHLGNDTLEDLHKKYGEEKIFMISSFDLYPEDKDGNISNFCPVVYNSSYQKCKEEKLVDIALRTS
ncbi:MAG: patatin-like phospholipase family protein, partial [Saprospiraceae bacterium]